MKNKSALILMSLLMVLGIILFYPESHSDQTQISQPKTENPQKKPEECSAQIDDKPKSAETDSQPTISTIHQSPASPILSQQPIKAKSSVFDNYPGAWKAKIKPSEQFPVPETLTQRLDLFEGIDHADLSEEVIRGYFSNRLELAYPVPREGKIRREFSNLSGDLHAESVRQARQRASAEGIQLEGSNERGEAISVIGFMDGKPIYMVALNVNAAVSTAASYVRQSRNFDTFFGPDINGEGFIVNVHDDGVTVQHNEFQRPNGGGSRLEERGVAKASNHADHVSGTIGAYGYDPSLKGMAPNVFIYSTHWMKPGDVYLLGMEYPFQPKRAIIGSYSMGPDVIPGSYIPQSAEYENAFLSTPYYLFFAAAGNSGAGFETVNGGENACKNVILIANGSDRFRDESGNMSSGGTLHSTSSRGPTDDGRIKPDLTANGENLKSTYSKSSYQIMTGTSMATPNASGSAVLLQDYFSKRFPGHLMRAVSLKNLLLHTAEDMGDVGPDYEFGWGYMNILRAGQLIKSLAEQPGNFRMREGYLRNGEIHTYSFNWDGLSEIRVNLAWEEPAGQVVFKDADRAPDLVNDLDLRVLAPSTLEHLPWAMPFVINGFIAADRTTPAVKHDNSTDNNEQVLITTPTEAGVYTIVVRHKGNLTMNTRYSLIISGGETNINAAAPTISSFTPTRGFHENTLVTITGTGFQLGAEVTLEATGLATISGCAEIVTPTQIEVHFPLDRTQGANYTLVVTNPDGQKVLSENPFNVPQYTAFFQENFDNGFSYASAGWTTSAVQGVNKWTLSTQYASSGNSAYSPTITGQTESYLETPSIIFPNSDSDFTLSFLHRWDFEIMLKEIQYGKPQAADGGVLQVKIDNGSWVDVDNTVAANMMSNGYWGALHSSNPLYYSNTTHGAWTDNSGDKLVRSTVLLKSSYFKGKTARFRWTIGTRDDSVTLMGATTWVNVDQGPDDIEGWWIDDVVLAFADNNTLPKFESIPSGTANQSRAYNQTVRATDPDGNVLSITAPLRPSWLSITDHGDGTATLSGTPGASDLQKSTVTLRVSDGSGHSELSYFLVVTPANGNTPPIFATTTLPKGNVSQAYSQMITASDIDGQKLELTVSGLPSWAVTTDHGNGTATISGTPTAPYSGNYLITLCANDGIISTKQGIDLTIMPLARLSFVNEANRAVLENSGSVSFTVRRDANDTGVVSVAYNTTNGTATQPSDYTAKTGTLTWADGDMSDKTLTVPLVDDFIPESTENYTFSLKTPSGLAELAYGTNILCTITILDNDIKPEIKMVSPATGNVQINSGSNLLLDATATDGDNLPNALVNNWTMVTGPGMVTFGDNTKEDTTAIFSTDGLYVLRISSYDGAARVSRDINVGVGTIHVAREIVANDDFTTKNTLGGLGWASTWTSSNIYFGNDLPYLNNSFFPTMRFKALSSNARRSVDLSGLTGPRLTFVRRMFFRDISNNTTLEVNDGQGWQTVQKWIYADGFSTNWATEDLDLSAYGSMVNGYQIRFMHSANTISGPPIESYIGALVLNVNANRAPNIEAGPDLSSPARSIMQLSGTVNDDGYPLNNPPIALTWSMLSGPGTAIFGDSTSANTSLVLDTEGIYTFQLKASDGESCTVDTLQVTATPAELGIYILETNKSTHVTEGGSSDTYQIELNSAPTNDVTVTIATDSQLSVAPSSIIFTPNNWNTPQVVVVTAVDDSNIEFSHTGYITHSCTSLDRSYNNCPLKTLLVQVADNDLPGVIAISSSAIKVGEGDGSVAITVTRSSGNFGAISVDYTSVNGTAQAGSDFIAVSGTITWTDGDESPKTIVLSLIDDGDIDPDENFSLQLSQATGESTLEISNATVTLIDNEDLPLLLNEKFDYGDSDLESGYGSWNDTSVNSVSYKAYSSLVFSNVNYDQSTNIGGCFSANYTSSIRGAQMTFSHSAQTGTFWFSCLIMPISTTGNNVIIGFNDVANYSSTNLSKDRFGIGYKGGILKPMFYDYSLVTATYGSNIGIVNKGTYLLVAKLQITGGVDTLNMWIFKENDSFTASEIGLGTPVLSVSDADFGSAIKNLWLGMDRLPCRFDMLRLSLAPGDTGVAQVLGYSVSPNTKIVSYNSNGATSGSIPTNQIKTEGVDLILASNIGNLVRTGYTFNGWNTSADGRGTDYAVSSTYNSDADLILFAKWDAISNPNPVNLTLISSNLSVYEGTSANINVRLSAAPSGTVVIGAVKTYGDLDLSILGSNSLSFSESNWNINQSLAIAAAQDADTLNGSANIELRSSSGVNSVTPMTITVTEIDDDIAGLTLSPSAFSVSENGSSNTFSVVLKTIPTANVIIMVNNPDNTEVALSNNVVIFTPANWNITQTVTATGVDDAIADGNVDVVLGVSVISADTGYNGLIVTGPKVTNLDDAIVVTVNTAGNGTTVPAGSQNFDPDGTLTLLATTNANYHFTGWSLTSGTGTFADANASNTSFIPSNVSTVTANFAINTYVLTFVHDNTAGASLLGSTSQTIAHGANASAVTAVTPAGYTFSRWSMGGTTISNLATLTASNITAVGTYKAEFTANTVAMVLNTGSIEVREGDQNSFSVKLSAQPSKTTFINMAITGDSDLSLSPVTLTFTTDNWAVNQTVAVSASQDVDILNGNATLSMTAVGIASVAVTATEIDDDILSLILNKSTVVVPESGSTTFLVQLSAAADITLTLTLTGDGDISISPTSLNFTLDNWNISQTVTVSADSDGDASDGTASMALSGMGINAMVSVTEKDDDIAPVIDQGASVAVVMSEDASPTDFALSLSATDVGDTLSWSIFSNATHGSANINSAGVVGYLPHSNFNGAESFVVTVTDSLGLTDSIAVNVTVLAINDAPSVESLNLELAEDHSVMVPLVYNDIDGDTLTVKNSEPSLGRLSGTLPNLIYTPAANVFGRDNFTISFNDGTLTTSANVWITVNAVNDAPVINPTGGIAILTDVNEPISFSVLGTDSEFSDIRWVISTPAHGTASLTSSANTAEITYTPQSNFYGSDRLTITAMDSNGATDSSVVAIEVRPPNRAPIFANPNPTVTMSEDRSPKAFVYNLDVSDPDGDVLSASITSAASHGIASVTPNGTVGYEPSADWHGIDNFVVTVKDSNGLSASATVSVTVLPVNDVPTLSGKVITVEEFSEYGLGFDLLGYADIDGDKLNYLRITDLPTHGQLKLSGNPMKVGDKFSLSDLLNLRWSFMAKKGQTVEKIGLVAHDGLSESAKTYIAVKVLDLTAPALKADHNSESPLLAMGTVSFTFDEAVLDDATENSAKNPANYLLSGSSATGRKVASVNGSDAGPYSLTFDGPLRDGSLNITFVAIEDINGNKIKPITINRTIDGLQLLGQPTLRAGHRQILWAMPEVEIVAATSSDTGILMANTAWIEGLQPGTVTLTLVEKHGSTEQILLNVKPPQINSFTMNLPDYGSKSVFSLVNFPIHATNFGKLRALLESKLGVMGLGNWMLYTYTGGEIEIYEVPTDESEIGPTTSYWLATINPRNLNFSEFGPATDDVLSRELKPGWNLVGNPYDSTLSIDHFLVRQGAGFAVLRSENQTTLGRSLFVLNEEHNGYNTVSSLSSGQGGWIYNGTSNNQILLIDPTSQLQSKPHMSKVDTELEPPAPPSNKVSAVEQAIPTLTTPQTSTVSPTFATGGGGCLLK